jgi:hypothetical protein
MGKKIVSVSVDLVCDLITEGTCHGGYEVRHGIPDGSQVKDARHRSHHGGMIELIVEHDSWPETPDGMPYPTLDVVVHRLHEEITT